MLTTYISCTKVVGRSLDSGCQLLQYEGGYNLRRLLISSLKYLYLSLLFYTALCDCDKMATLSKFILLFFHMFTQTLF